MLRLNMHRAFSLPGGFPPPDEAQNFPDSKKWPGRISGRAAGFGDCRGRRNGPRRGNARSDCTSHSLSRTSAAVTGLDGRVPPSPPPRPRTRLAHIFSDMSVRNGWGSAPDVDLSGVAANCEKRGAREEIHRTTSMRASRKQERDDFVYSRWKSRKVSRSKTNFSTRRR